PPADPEPDPAAARCPGAPAAGGHHRLPGAPLPVLLPEAPPLARRDRRVRRSAPAGVPAVGPRRRRDDQTSAAKFLTFSFSLVRSSAVPARGVTFRVVTPDSLNAASRSRT